MTQRNNQGMTTALGNEAKREKYHNFNVMLRHQLPANMSTSVAYIGARGNDLPFDLANDRNINRIPYDARRSTATCCSARSPASRNSASRRRTRALPGRCSRRCGPIRSSRSDAVNDFRGKTRYDSLQATIERRYSTGFAVLGAYTWSRTEDLILTQDGSGEEWSKAPFRHVPHFLKVTWVYDLPIGPGKAIDVDGVLGQIVGGWTMTGIHNYRAGGTLACSTAGSDWHGLPDPSERRRRRGPGDLRRVAPTR